LPSLAKARVVGLPATHLALAQDENIDSDNVPVVSEKLSSTIGCVAEIVAEITEAAQRTNNSERTKNSEDVEITLESLRAKRDFILAKQAALRAALNLNREPHESQPDHDRVFQVGDLVALRQSCGVPCEFHGKIAIINNTAPSHCTVFLLSEACTHGVAELWPTYVDLEPISTLSRIGSRVVCSGIPPDCNGCYLNGLMATVQEHPSDGHPQWPDMRDRPDKGGGRLFVFVVPDAVEGKKRKRPMSVPLRYLQPAGAAEMEWHTNELLRIATSKSAPGGSS